MLRRTTPSPVTVIPFFFYFLYIELYTEIPVLFDTLGSHHINQTQRCAPARKTDDSARKFSVQVSYHCAPLPIGRTVARCRNRLFSLLHKFFVKKKMVSCAVAGCSSRLHLDTVDTVFTQKKNDSRFQNSEHSTPREEALVLGKETLRLDRETQKVYFYKVRHLF